MSKNRVNCYTCPLGHNTVTIDIDEGVTPMFLRCKTEGCKEQSTSSMYSNRVQGMTPKWEWWKPNDAERKQIIDEFIATIPKNVDHYEDRVDGAKESFNHHFDNGGLDIRKRKMKAQFRILGMSAPASFTCQCDKEDLFWAKDGLSDGAYKKLFDWAKNDDSFWKQEIFGTIVFDSLGMNGSAINGKVISIIIT